MTSRTRRGARWLTLVLGALLVTACGVGAEELPRALPADPAGDQVVAPDEENWRAGVLTELWFAQNEQLVPINRTSDSLLTNEEKLKALEAGPTTTEAAQGLRTALAPVLPDVPLVITAEADGVPIDVPEGQTAVVLNPEFVRLPSQEQLLILGQVVLTLNELPSDSVLFVDDEGSPVGVPLPNGRLTSEPVTIADYAQLIGD